jgi:uridine phosphorylase
MNKIEESELLINNRGAIYHLNVRPEELADIIITVGDQNRVKEVSKYFDSVECICKHREFIMHTGYLGKKRISVVSTGIGTGNIDIVLNELDALVNIDLDTRTIKKEHTSLTIIRMGTSGSLQADIPVDDFVASTHVVGIDNLLHYYQHTNNDEERSLIQHFVAYTQMDAAFSQPYIASAAASVLKHFVHGFHQGITVTCPGFYGPQGRVLRLGLTNPQLIDRLTEFYYGNRRIINFEMETSAIYGLGNLLGHRCVSLSVIIVNRINKTFTKDVIETVENLIKKGLEIIERI